MPCGHALRRSRDGRNPSTGKRGSQSNLSPWTDLLRPTRIQFRIPGRSPGSGIASDPLFPESVPHRGSIRILWCNDGPALSWTLRRPSAWTESDRVFLENLRIERIPASCPENQPERPGSSGQSYLAYILSCKTWIRLGGWSKTVGETTRKRGIERTGTWRWMLRFRRHLFRETTDDIRWNGSG